MSSGARSAQTTGHRSRAWIAFTLPVAAIAIWRVALFIARVPFAAPFQYDYEEGNILNALSRIVQGASSYPDPHALPNVINPYGPAAYYLLAIARLFGVTFVYPRALILACAVAVASLLVLELHRMRLSPPIAASFGLIFVAIANIQQWMWLLRVDFLALLFTTAGLVVFSRELQNRPDQPRSRIPALLFALALLVKITLLAAPAACVAALLARRRFRCAFHLALETTLIFAAVMAGFAAATQAAVLTDVFLSHPDPFSFRVFTGGLTTMLVQSWPLVALAVFAIARDLSQRRFTPSVLWLILATAGAVTAGKLGSNSNHFVEWNAAVCLAAGIGFRDLLSLPRHRHVACAAAGFAIVVALALQPRFVVNPVNRDCVRAYDWLAAHPGDIISENVGALALTDHKVWVSNPFVLAQEVEHSGWSDTRLVHMVRDRRFDAIFTGRAYTEFQSFRDQGTERFSPEFVRALAENYAPSPGFACLDMTVLYRPKAPAALQSNQVSRP